MKPPARPMKLLKVAAGVLNQTPLDWQANESNILAAIAAAREKGAQQITLVSDPNAAGFYLKHGAVKTTAKEAVKRGVAGNPALAAAARAVGIDRSTFYHWKSYDPRFAAAVRICGRIRLRAR